jgi:signal transduction histidine kinase
MKSGLRRRLTISVTAVSALTLLILVALFNLALRSSLDADANRLLDARVSAALEGVEVKGGKVSIGEASDEGAPDAQVWIYSGGRNIERPLVDRTTDQLADSLAATGSGKAEEPDGDIRLQAASIESRGESAGTVVAGISLEPYERTARRTLVASIVLALFVLILIAVATRIVVDRALRPVARMTADAADWSEHDLDRRFNPGGATDELTELASTFDGMLDRMAAMVRHERNFSAEISHELRTPLSSISAEAEVALLRDRDEDSYRHSLERISTRARELTEILETLLSVARAGGSDPLGASSDLDEVVTSAVRSAEESAGRSGITIETEPSPSPTPVQGNAEALQRVLAPVIENACAYARSSVRVNTEAGPIPTITVSDDGPGIDPVEAETIFEPGRQGSAERNAAFGSGTGLGLSLSRRLARALGGDVQVVGDSGPGAQVRVTLPRALG